MSRIYPDVCCLNRPFDDQRQDRIRLEAEAVLLILGRYEVGEWQWLSSAVVEEEVNNTPSRERRSRGRNMLSGAYSTVALTDTAVARAQEVKAMGFRTYDALHLTCAEGAMGLPLTQSGGGEQGAAFQSRFFAVSVTLGV